ncbi:MAG: SH3 domain-containing protein [Anaerolineae bacterium]|nr:SH3 domain-containing protein [Anaerolineae bacterium]
MQHRTYIRKKGWVALLALIIALLPVTILGGTAQAQGGETITYGTGLVGDLTAETPFAIYSVNMNSGDMVSVVVAGLTPDMAPAIGMVGPDQRPIAQSEADPLGAASGRLARLDHRATQAGNYTLIITNANSTAGQFALVLDGRPTPAGTTIPPGAEETVNLLPGAAPVVYGFQPSTESNLVLSLNTDTPGFSFVARVFDWRGHLVARLAGMDLRGALLNIGPGSSSGQYLVEIAPLNPDVQGAVQVGLAVGSAAQAGGGTTTTVITPTPSVCQVRSNNRVNVRSGPSTDYPSFGSLMPDTSLNVVGRNNITSWYVVDYSGRQGWVAASVVEIGGPCGTLPFVADPPLPATPTPVPTTTPTAPSISFTSTVGDGMTYPPGTCFTFYWTVSNIREVYFDGDGVSGQGQRERCPNSSRSYVLRVVYLDGSSREFAIPVSISAP